MRTVRFDPHVHTAASYDSTAPVEAVLEHAREAGLDALAVTDHDTTASAVRSNSRTSSRSSPGSRCRPPTVTCSRWA
jgi:predicted metal-dependent phosphoesterase TrpH